jgi:translation initiation factor eIF-2B subunit gamma
MLICPTTHRHLISHHIHSSFSTLRIDIQPYEEAPDDAVGTCTLLRHFASRILQDFIILSCDFLPPPSLHLSTVLNKFRTESVSDGCIATTCWYVKPDSPSGDKAIFPEEWLSSAPMLSLVWEKKTGSLLHMDTMEAVDKNGEDIELKMSLLNMCVSTSFSCVVVSE